MTLSFVELGSVCKFENGDRGKNYPAKGTFVSEGIPFINAGNLTNAAIDTQNLNFISEESFNLLNSGKTRSGDILFCLRGSLGKYAVVRESSQGAIRGLQIPIPLPSLQRKFASAMEAVQLQNARTLDSLGAMEKLFASLQHRAFQGEL